uniref:carboxylesterase n=1 Tax=Calliphora stygia TaxID=145453 RepID=A0A068F511_CALSG|nr:esterase [Calliphora stygia]
MHLNEKPVIQTTTGKVRGEKRQTVYGDEFYCFDGIPYAKAPIGELRFKAPLPVERWPGVKDCTQIANKCLQWNRYAQEVQGSEDCLYLNVYAKNLNSSTRLPVMVYLHGGGFNTGDATRLSWGPDYFMMKDVVFITIGYRLGLLGFAHFKDKSLEIPGNAGLKDIILALRWIHDNCENFNGSADNITLFGHSSGSCSTHLLMLSPSAKGLFHKAILMAGFSMELADIPDLQFRLAKHLGYQGSEDNEKEICKFLTEVDYKRLVGFDIWTQEEKEQNNSYPFMPTLETYIDENSIITDDPVIMQRHSWSNNIPLMMGCTSSEANIQYKRFATDESLQYRKYPHYLLPKNLQNLKDENLKMELASKFRDLHFGDKPVTIANYQCALENQSYGIYHAQHRILQSRLKNSTASTYLYRFDFDSPFFNLYRLKHCGPNVRGVGHVDELSYIFFMPGSYKLDTTSPEYKCIEQMIESFYSFAKSSNPTNSKIQPAYWEPVCRTGIPQCLNISYDSTDVINQPEYEKCCVRDELYRMADIILY